MKIFVILILVAILVSLGSGLFFLTRDGHGSSRMLNALKIRVGLSLFLVLFLVSAYFLGWIQP